jgi:uncharacterized protein with PIN domain
MDDDEWKEWAKKVEENLEIMAILARKETQAPPRCPQCKGPITLLRPKDISGVPKLMPFCKSCYDKDGP